MYKQFNNIKIRDTITASCNDLLFKRDCRFNIYDGAGTPNPFFLIGIGAPRTLTTFAANANTELSKQQLVDFNGWGRVASDALTAFNRLMDAGVKDYFHELWAEYCDQEIQFRTHSFSCCVGQMMLVYLFKNKMWSSDKLGFLGTGCPRCGDQEFASNVDKATVACVRVNFIDDPVPNLPPTTCTKNTNAVAGSGTDCWFHGCSLNVRYTEYKTAGLTKKWDVCTTAEEEKCHQGNNVQHHTRYFQVPDKDWESKTCSIWVLIPYVEF